MNKLMYQPGKENKEYWELLDKLRTKGKSISSTWAGDYLIQTYEMDGDIYEVWENEELGIQYKIERRAK
jgi:hypothetical protein